MSWQWEHVEEEIVHLLVARKQRGDTGARNKILPSTYFFQLGPTF
jgi:hypothetical protein